MLKNLPAWKAFILVNIDSCKTVEQLTVCDEFINLFNVKYSGWISSLELAKHNIDLHEALDRKKEMLDPKPIQQ